MLVAHHGYHRVQWLGRSLSLLLAYDHGLISQPRPLAVRCLPKTRHSSVAMCQTFQVVAGWQCT